MADQQTSEFNYAFAWLNRLNHWFWLAGISSQELDAYSWYMNLLTIYREISTEMKSKYSESAQAEKLKGELLPLVVAWVQVRNKKGLHINQELFMKLDEFEIVLRKIMDRAGLQTKRIDDRIRM